MFFIVGFLVHQILGIVGSQIETNLKIKQSNKVNICEQKLAK
jgi:hypothetical protein